MMSTSFADSGLYTRLPKSCVLLRMLVLMVVLGEVK